MNGWYRKQEDWNISYLVALFFRRAHGRDNNHRNLPVPPRESSINPSHHPHRRIVNIPWMLKFVWGPIIDFFIRFGRKPSSSWGALTVSCMFFVSFLDPTTSLIPFTCLIFLSHVGIGFIDVSADAWLLMSQHTRIGGKSMVRCLPANTQPGLLVQRCFPSLARNMGIIPSTSSMHYWSFSSFSSHSLSPNVSRWDKRKNRLSGHKRI